MTPVLAFVLATAPCVYWTQGVESRATLEAAGIKRICVAPERADGWKAAGFTVTPVTDADLSARESLPVPGVAARAGVASPTRAPWIVASGWRFTRRPAAKYVYEVPAGKAALAAAEAYAYGADVVLKIDPTDLKPLGAMLAFLEGLAAADMPPAADLAVVDDGSAVTGEVMNLLNRRNLLFQPVGAPSSRFPITIAVGTPAYPAEEAADPSAFALKIRRQLGDDQRTLRVFGSEVVICRLTSDGSRARLQLLNYGGRDIEGLRIRLRGTYSKADAVVAGVGKLPLSDFAAANGATEFSVPKLTTYAVIDLLVTR
jgi:hypothetical protein